MSFHIFHINEVYSNAQGTIQYIEFVGDSNNQQFWAGHQITSSNGKTYNITEDLPSNLTSGKSVLVATQAFADLGLVTPDYIIPSGFLPVGGGTVSFPGMDSLTFGALPTNGTQSRDGSGNVIAASPSNFDGDSSAVTGVAAGVFFSGSGAANNKTTGGGADALFGNGGNDTLNGGSGNDILNGGSANDKLNGGGGRDTMAGGAGNDTFFVNVGSDVVKESSGGGTDTVSSSVTEILANNVERLILTGNGNINGTGNALDNILTGNSGNNVLNGRGGKDILKGAGGSDTLIWSKPDVFDGGGGTDKLKVKSGDLDLTAIADTKIKNVEIIDMTGANNNTLTLALGDVLAINGADTLRIDGNVDDMLNVTDAGDWTQSADQVIGAVTYHSYTNGVATLLVDVDVTSNLAVE